jgi:hypothetical protein
LTPRLHLAAVDVEAEPVAAPAPVVEDRATIDRREINRRAVKFWPVIKDYLHDWHGRSLVRHLGPGHIPQDPNRTRIPVPTVKELKGPMPWMPDGTTGSWYDVGTGARGDSPIELVMWLGACDNKTATNYLRDLTDRLAEIKS